MLGNLSSIINLTSDLNHSCTVHPQGALAWWAILLALTDPPPLQGRRLSEIHRRFTRGLVLGVYDTRTKKTTLNPPVSRKLKGRDMLVMMRPTSVGKNDYKPMAEAVDVDMGAPLT